MERSGEPAMNMAGNLKSEPGGGQAFGMEAQSGNRGIERTNPRQRVAGGGWWVAGRLWNGRVHAKIAELDERTRGAQVARSVKGISTIRVAAFGSRSARLTEVARLRRGRQTGTGEGIHLEQKLAKGAVGFYSQAVVWAD
jgi:hypothetical protein